MIEAIMIFALGTLVAALMAIAFLPALWRRAVRLTRRELEATLPLTPGEMAAEKDQLRAAHAVDIRRIETRLEASEASVQHARAEIGDKTSLIQRHDATIATNLAMIAHLEATLTERDTRIASHEETIAVLEKERDNLATNLSASRISNQALDQETINLRQAVDQSLARQATLSQNIEGLEVRLSESKAATVASQAESRQRLDELRATARSLRSAEERAVSAERRLSAAETAATERQSALETLQTERLRLIEEAGTLTRERDFERVERETMASQTDGLRRQIDDLEAATLKSRGHNNDVIKDLTRTIELLRQDKQQADGELSTMRIEKARLQTEVTRLRKRDVAAAKTSADAAIQ